VSKLRVLHIVHDHASWTAAGTELLAGRLVSALEAMPGISATLLAMAMKRQRADAPGFDRVERDICAAVGTYDRFMMARLDCDRWANEIIELLDAEQFDIVHLHGVDRVGVETIAIIRSRRPSTGLLLTLHDYQLICTNDGLMVTTDGVLCHGASIDRCRGCFPSVTAERLAMREAYLRAALEEVDLFIAPSNFLCDRFLRWGLDARRIVTLENPAPGYGGGRQSNSDAKTSRKTAGAGRTQLFGPRRDRKSEPPPRRNRFGFFGNIARHKGVLVLLDAARRLQNSGTSFSLTLHGRILSPDAEFRDAFDRGMAEIADVARHGGPYRPDDLPDLMNAVDWVVMPSLWWENGPLVLAEARRHRKPVICSGIGGMAEMIVANTEGLHVPPGDAAALAAAMGEAVKSDRLWDDCVAKLRPAVDLADYASAHADHYRRIQRARAS